MEERFVGLGKVEDLGFIKEKWKSGEIFWNDFELSQTNLNSISQRATQDDTLPLNVPRQLFC